MSDQTEKLNQLEKSFAKEIVELKRTSKDKSIEDLKRAYQEFGEGYIGKNSKLLEILKSLKDIKDPEEKKKIGQSANNLKIDISTKLKKELDVALGEKLKEQLVAEIIDPTRPGILPNEQARQHIVTSTINRIEDIFLTMGFEVEYSLEIDNAFNAFDAVNIPENHPARDNWDTLWMSDGNLAIPHTSAMQNRILKANEVPIRKIIIGKCFRNEATDVTHEHTFYQVEGVYLNKTANMAEMLGVLLEFLQSYFGREFNYKFTPDFFPFVEPGGQLAIEWQEGKYLEILGCGMIHPNVIKAAGKSPAEYSGFAWGFGLERLILLNEKIEDIRLFYSGDYRFTQQFN